MAGITIHRSDNIHLKDGHIEGSDVGIEVTDSSITATDISFQNVGQAWKIDGRSTADIRGSRVADTRNPPPHPAKASRGWTSSPAPALPVLCGTCGAISPSRHHQFRGLYFNLWDNEEPCPKCGNPAKLSEGVFNLAKETVEVLKGPDVTRAMLSALLSAGASYESGQLSTHEALAKVEEVSPALSALVQRTVRTGAWLSGGLIAFFSITNGYAEFVKNYGVDPMGVTVDFLVDHVLPRLDLPSLQEAMEPGGERDLNAKGANPSQRETVPETVPEKLSTNHADKI